MATREDLYLDLGQLEAQRSQALLTVQAVGGAIQYVRQKIAELDASVQPAPAPPATS